MTAIWACCSAMSKECFGQRRQIAHIGKDFLRPGGGEARGMGLRIGMGSGKPQHGAAGANCRGDAGDAVLDHDALVRPKAGAPRGFDEDIGRRFSIGDMLEVVMRPNQASSPATRRAVATRSSGLFDATLCAARERKAARASEIPATGFSSRS